MAAVLSTNMTLSRVISTIRDLPPAPAIAVRVMRLTSNLDANVEAISELLSADQALSSRVLRMANSPAYGRSHEVQSISEGVMVLGFETIRTVIVAAAMHSMFVGEQGNELHSRLWEHSLSTAVAARLLGQRAKRPDTEMLYLAGLLHDVGKLVILTRLPKEFNRIVQAVKNQEGSFSEMEVSVLGFMHCDVASLLLTKWVFPMPLTQAVCNHHRQFDLSKGSKNIPPAFVIQTADFLSKTMDIGFQDSSSELEQELTDNLSILLPPDQCCDIIDEVRQLFEQERTLFMEP